MTHTEKVYIAGFATCLACYNNQSTNYLMSIFTDLGVSWEEVDRIIDTFSNPSAKENAYRELRWMGADDKKKAQQFFINAAKLGGLSQNMMILKEILTSCNMFDATV